MDDDYLFAEFVPFESLFGAIVRPQAVIPLAHYTKDDEPHPATHGMESDE